MPKQHVYEVRIREYHDITVLVAARTAEEARRAATRRYDTEALALEFSELETPELWQVTDLGEDEGQ